MNEDMKNGGAAARKAVKGALGSKKEYVQTTHTIATSEGISFDPKQVHHAVTEEWSEKVFKSEDKKRIGRSSNGSMTSTSQRYHTPKEQSTARTYSKQSSGWAKQCQA